MAYGSPLDPGTYTVGRTDEGVDFGVRAGAAIRSIGAAVVDFVGRYQGFGPYVAYHLTKGPLAGEEIYSAEGEQILVHRGQRLRAGQPIARATGASSGIEMGFAQRRGSYLPEANPSYSEGDVTPAGRRFASTLSHLGLSSSPGNYGFVELQQLWVNAGGPKAEAPLMAAIALAESHGNPKAHLVTKKEDSRGFWQINVRAHPDLAHGDLFDPHVNAQAAVAVYRSSGPGAWSTYTNGAYADYMSGAPDNSPMRVRPGGDAGGSDGSAELASWYGDTLKGAGGLVVPEYGAFELATGLFSGVGNTFDAVKVFFKAIMWLFSPRNWLRLFEVLAGGGLIVLGLIALLLNFLQKNDLPVPVPGAAGVALNASKALRRGRRGAGRARRPRRSTSSGAVDEARVATERERAKEVRSRRRERIERARETRAEREKREKRAYLRGAADSEGFSR